jgi:hypothetical protein
MGIGRLGFAVGKEGFGKHAWIAALIVDMP